jgi:two-component system sensor histidine kinase/response regulator
MVESHPAERPLTILVIDDDQANRELARETLEDEGYRVVLASGGRAGVAAFERETPDCILLDVRMPEMDGFFVCEQIRTLPRGKDTPLIFLTAARNIDTFDRALRAGGDDFVTKPVRPTELVVRVGTALKLRRARSELNEHYELLKRQRDDLLRLQLQKERLMAFVVHDLKNPVGSMDLLAQVLAQDDELSASARDTALQIRGEARQLNRMIQNLLDLSKADEGKLVAHPSTLDFHQLVADVFGELEMGAAARDVTLASSLDIHLATGDGDLLRRMLANLIENAIRHAPAGTAVQLTAIAKDGETELRVRDSGTGIPPEMCEKVFDPFVQVDDEAQRNRAGRGLGLAFCKLAALAHGGRIWVENAAPGAVFCVSLPHER